MSKAVVLDLMDVEEKEEATDTDLCMIEREQKEQDGEGKRTKGPREEGKVTKLQEISGDWWLQATQRSVESTQYTTVHTQTHIHSSSHAFAQICWDSTQLLKGHHSNMI